MRRATHRQLSIARSRCGPRASIPIARARGEQRTDAGSKRRRITVEPFVRRRWPQMLISWTRLLSGRFNDPMVGRDILIGAAAATLAIGTWQVTLLIAGTTTFLQPSTLGPPRFVFAQIANTLGEAV